MSRQERPSEKRDKPAPAAPRPQRRAEGHSGHGADSALKHLREWERRRASDFVAPDKDRPSGG